MQVAVPFVMRLVYVTMSAVKVMFEPDCSQVVPLVVTWTCTLEASEAE